MLQKVIKTKKHVLQLSLNKTIYSIYLAITVIMCSTPNYLQSRISEFIHRF